MKWLGSRIFWGALLVAGGILFLLDNLEVITIGGLFWAVILGIAGIGFLSVYITARQNWWALIPGSALLAVAVLMLLEFVFPEAAGNLGDVIVVGGIGTAFLIIYLTNREHWWAIFPTGVLFTLAVISGIENAFPGLETEGLFFLGIGLTFAVLAVLPNPLAPMRWALIPAAVLVIIGLVFLASALPLFANFWPVALILVGFYFVYRAFQWRR